MGICLHCQADLMSSPDSGEAALTIMSADKQMVGETDATGRAAASQSLYHGNGIRLNSNQGVCSPGGRTSCNQGAQHAGFGIRTVRWHCRV